jgi:hypothetical protein
VKRRKQTDLYVGISPTAQRHWILATIGRALYRWRWQLTPLYVALPLPFAGWGLALLWAFAHVGWFIAVFAVAAACTVCWLIVGMTRTYDRIFAAMVALVVLGWLLALAWHPSDGHLYGVWALGWPVAGLGWWCGPALRSAATLDRMRQRWDSVAELAGIAGAKLTNVKNTSVGRVLTVVLPGNNTARDVNRDRIESGYQYRRGSVTVVPDKANARRVDLHVVDRDPWESGRTIAHPAIAALPDIDPTDGDDDTTNVLHLDTTHDTDSTGDAA